MRSVQVVPESEIDVLSRRWQEQDRTGFDDAGGDPFRWLRMRSYSYGHAANPGMDGYVFRAWVRPPGVSQPLQASGRSLLVAVLSLVCRSSIRFEKALNQAFARVEHIKKDPAIEDQDRLIQELFPHGYTIGEERVGNELVTSVFATFDEAHGHQLEHQLELERLERERALAEYLKKDTE